MAKEIEELKIKHNVILLYFDQVSTNIERGINIIPIKIRKIDKIMNVLLHPLIANQFATRKSYSVEKLIKETIISKQIDAIHVEYAVMGQYIGSIKRAFPDIPCNLVLHDVTYQSYLRQIDNARSIIKRLYLRWQARLIKRQEYSYICKADNVLVFSDKDQKLVSEWYHKESKVISTYFDIDSRVIKGKNRYYDDTEKAICFFGQLSREENANAARRLVKISEHLDKSIKVYIVGDKPPQDLLELNDERIQVTGFVDDPDEILSRCRLAVFPLMVGAGIKIKVLHCLALGIPVVTTMVGTEGIDEEGRVIKIVTSDKEIEEAINGMIDDISMQRNIGREGIKLVENSFSWGKTINVFSELYNV